MTTTIERNATFWNTTPLEQLSRDEWEALCDGCAKCCLHKLEDEEDGEVYYTDLACSLLDINVCSCSNYAQRHQQVPHCISFTAEDVQSMHWLPDTCAYKLRSQGEPLYDWHYLISGSRDSIHQAAESVRDFAVLDCGQDAEEHILHFRP